MAAMGSAAAAAAPGALSTAASPTTALVWRLSANWGYAVPPKSKTRCRCRACASHAANKVFVSQAAAIAGRIHPCCVCQPYSVELLADDAADLFPMGASSTPLDLRNPVQQQRFVAAVERSMSPPETAPPTTTPATNTPPTTTPPTTDPPTTTPSPGPATNSPAPAQPEQSVGSTTTTATPNGAPSAANQATPIIENSNSASGTDATWSGSMSGGPGGAPAAGGPQAAAVTPNTSMPLGTQLPVTGGAAGTTLFAAGLLAVAGMVALGVSARPEQATPVEAEDTR